VEQSKETKIHHNRGATFI